MSHHTVTMGDRGRLVIPAETRRRLGLSAGDRLVLSDENGELRLLPVSARVKALCGGWADAASDRQLVDELIADRRNEAARE